MNKKSLTNYTTWGCPTSSVALRLNYEAHTKAEVGQTLRSWLITFLLLIRYVMLWLWPLTLWRWTSEVYRLWRDQILAKSNNPRLRYGDFKDVNSGADLHLGLYGRWTLNVARPLQTRNTSIYKTAAKSNNPRLSYNVSNIKIRGPTHLIFQEP